MATLAEQRKAIQERNTKERRASDGADARRQSGRDMVERRTGKQQVDDINAFLNPPKQKSSLRTLEARGGLPAQRGSGAYVAPPASSGGGGVASPLTVQQIVYAEEPSYVATFDASGYFAVKKIARMVMVDAEGRQIIVEGFADLDENGNPKPPENPNG